MKRSVSQFYLAWTNVRRCERYPIGVDIPTNAMSLYYMEDKIDLGVPGGGGWGRRFPPETTITFTHTLLTGVCQSH